MPSSPAQHFHRASVQRRGQLRIELRTGALVGQCVRRGHPADPVCNLDVLRELGDPRGYGNRVSRELSRPTATVPLLVRGAERVANRLGQSELLRERAGERRVLRNHVVHLAVPRHGKLEPDPYAAQRRVPGPDHLHPRRDRAQTAHGIVVLPGFQGNVVTEPFRLFVGVRVAADVDE